MKVHHIAITTKNLNKSIEFCQKFFNFELCKTFKRDDLKGKAAFLKLGDFSIEFWEFSDLIDNKDDFNNLKIKGIRHLAFEIEDLDKTFNDFKSQGLKITEPQIGASGHRYSFTSDPDGIALEFYQK